MVPLPSPPHLGLGHRGLDPSLVTPGGIGRCRGCFQIGPERGLRPVVCKRQSQVQLAAAWGRSLFPLGAGPTMDPLGSHPHQF